MNVDRATLQGLIDYLGLSIREASALLGIGQDALSRKLAGRERYEAREGEIATLAALADAVDAMVAESEKAIRRILVAHAPRETADEDICLLVYRRDEDLPPWAGLPFASTHRLAISRLARAIGPAVRLVVFDADRYRAWLGPADTQDSRADWAAREPRGKKFALHALGFAAIVTGPAAVDKLAGGVEPLD